MQDFSWEHEAHERNETSSANRWRYLCFGLNTFAFIHWLAAFGPSIASIYYLTNWAWWLTSVSLYLSYSASFDTNGFGRGSLSKKQPDVLKSQAWHNLLYSLAIVFNLIVMSVYWTLLHAEFIEQYKGDAVKQSYQWTCHTVPGLICLINTTVTKCVMKRGLIKVFILIALVYVCNNYLAVRKTGKAIYSFMTFEDPVETATNIGAIFGAAMTGYLALCIIDETVKGPIDSNPKKKTK